MKRADLPPLSGVSRAYLYSPLTSAIGRDVSITILAAPSRNYGARRRGEDHRAAESRTGVVGP